MMPWYAHLLGSVAAAVVNPPSTHPVAEEHEQICVVPLTRWSGTTEDVRRIVNIPVPDSFRRKMASVPCNTLDPGSLVTWHLAMGDEATTTVALTFLARTRLSRMPTPAVFLRTFPPIWQRALPRFRAADALLDGPGGFAAWQKAIAADPDVSAVRPLADAHAEFLFLAGEYLRAAEFFTSRSLLAKAKLYLAPASLGREIVYGDAEAAMADDPRPRSGTGFEQRRINLVRDLEARAAILTARISGTPGDRTAALATLEVGDVTLLKRAANNAFEHGDGMCDIGDADYLVAVKGACYNENDFEGRVTRYWRNRARADLLADSPTHPASIESFDLAMKLLRHNMLETDQSSITRIFDPVADAIAELLILRFDNQRSTITGRGLPSSVTARDDLFEALSLLIAAERYATPVTHPGRVRQIGERYLALWTALRPTADERRDRVTLTRFAALITRMLPALPQIATGEAP